MSQSEHPRSSEASNPGVEPGRTDRQAGNNERRADPRQRGQQVTNGHRTRETRRQDGQQPHQSRAQAQSRAGRTSIPTGFRLISLIFAGVGLALLAGGAVLVQGSTAVAAFAGPLASALVVVGVSFGVLGGVHLVAGYGTWTFKPWARRLGVVIAVGSALASMTVVLAGTPVGFVGVATHGAVAWYLHTNRQQYTRLGRLG